MVMVIAISGSSGFIGRQLQTLFPAPPNTIVALGRNWAMQSPHAMDGCGAVVHLAGEPVAQRWNSEIKNRIRTSRTEGTRQVVEAITKAKKKPQVLVCASAIGFYGSRSSETLLETSHAGSGFLPEVCQEWEAEADRVLKVGVRLVKLRIGMVLGRGGGALTKMETPFKLGAGGRIGSGLQWMSWIHIADLTRLIQFAVENESVSGVVNAVTPYPVTNEEFTKLFAAALHRPALFPVPEFAIKLLFGEMSSMILASQRVLPDAAQSAGFKFQFAGLESALSEIYG